MVEPIKSVCPKCGKEGTQHVWAPNKSQPNLLYLEIVHGKNNRHYIGRVRSEGEFIGEMNKPETKEEYEAALKEIARDINQLVRNYSNTKSGSVVRINKSLRAILAKYGY